MKTERLFIEALAKEAFPFATKFPYVTPLIVLNEILLNDAFCPEMFVLIVFINIVFVEMLLLEILVADIFVELIFPTILKLPGITTLSADVPNII